MKPDENSMVEDAFQLEYRSMGSDDFLGLSGSLTVHQVTRLHQRLGSMSSTSHLTIDLGGVDRFDTAGAWAVAQLAARCRGAGAELRVQNASAEVELLLKSVGEAIPEREQSVSEPATLRAFLQATGEQVSARVELVLELIGYLGLFLSHLGKTIIHPRELRLTSVVAHAESVGFKAVSIVALMAFLIGVVLAFQGSAQLRQFGAEVFVVDLIAISILRELGILLTAIIVAGRTASAFTAAIGSMKMREEIDAMRILGLDPASVLFVPRILALIIMLPILALIANLMGLFGGALMAWLELGISPSMFQARLLEGTQLSHVIVGLAKAPVFALIIGIVGCHGGMQVEGNAESLGAMTSNSVVTAIFAVIIADAVFSIFFSQVGL